MPPVKLLELQHVCNSLLKLKKTVMYEESEEDSEVDPNLNEPAPESFDSKQQVNTML